MEDFVAEDSFDYEGINGPFCEQFLITVLLCLVCLSLSLSYTSLTSQNLRQLKRNKKIIKTSTVSRHHSSQHTLGTHTRRRQSKQNNLSIHHIGIKTGVL